jgi:rhamnosyltransferase
MKQAYIGAVIVTFNPDPARLRHVVAATARQVGEIVLVDNGSTTDAAADLTGVSPNPLGVLALGDNYGIAAALNIGLARARERGCTHVLLLDQDGVPGPGMVNALLAEMRQREARGEKVAAVGPQIVDPRRAAPAPFFRLGRWDLRRIDAADAGEQSARIDFLITAGTLLSLAAAQKIGPMNEALFIDYVDLEWSLRARSLGYRLYGHFGVTLDHRLGDEPLQAFGRTMTAHSPLRHYYLMRNALALWRLPYTPWAWKCADALHLLRKFVVFSTLAPQRGAHCRMMLRGLADGLAGRYGRQDQAARDWQVPAAARATRPRHLAPAMPNTTILAPPA